MHNRVVIIYFHSTLLRSLNPVRFLEFSTIGQDILGPHFIKTFKISYIFFLLWYMVLKILSVIVKLKYEHIFL